MRRVTIALALLGIGFATLLAAFVHAGLVRTERERIMAENRALVATLGLTDPALFTEARYTRHLTQADLFTPFQDSPASFEHFPSGALVLPPPHIRRGHARLVGGRPPAGFSQPAGSGSE